MSANFACPSCGGRLADAGAENAWRCRACGEIVVEPTGDRDEHVREFFRRATAPAWRGLSG